MWKKEWGVRKHYSSSGRASIPFTCFCYLDFHDSQHIDRKDNFVGFLQRLCVVKPFSVISVTDSLMKLIEWFWRMTKNFALKKNLQLMFFCNFSVEQLLQEGTERNPCHVKQICLRYSVLCAQNFWHDGGSAHLQFAILCSFQQLLVFTYRQFLYIVVTCT